MTYFDADADYFGDRREMIIAAGNNRLSIRSIKIFADGKSPLRVYSRSFDHH